MEDEGEDMFLMMGVSPKKEQLDFLQPCVCNSCGRRGEIEVFKTTNTFSLFLLPIFHWGAHYYARMSCCGSLIEIDKELGEGIENGDIYMIDPELFPYRAAAFCPHCGKDVAPDDNYCPRCGKHL